MSRKVIEQCAITSNELQQQSTGLFLPTGDANGGSRCHRADHKLVAQWQLDESSKLYCKWVTV